MADQSRPSHYGKVKQSTVVWTQPSSTSPEIGARHLLSISEGPIEYRVTGRGPTVVFLHGIIANGDVWRGVVARLSRDHCCIVPDWPLGAHRPTMRAGTDFSLPGIAAMVDRFLAAAGLDQVVLVANDTGRAMAQHVVADRPARIALSDGCPSTGQRLDDRAGLHWPGLPAAMQQVRQRIAHALQVGKLVVDLFEPRLGD